MSPPFAYSPDPWKHDTHDGQDIVLDSLGNHIATILPDSSGKAIAGANAKLIAAAPQLLDALTQLYDCITYDKQPSSTPKWVAEALLKNAVRGASNAITSARGSHVQPVSVGLSELRSNVPAPLYVARVCFPQHNTKELRLRFRVVRGHPTDALLSLLHRGIQEGWVPVTDIRHAHVISVYRKYWWQFWR